MAVVLTVLAACTSETADLDVSTSVLDVETTSTTEGSPETTTTAPPPTSTTMSGLEPVTPNTATVVPVRVVRLADGDGSRQARVDVEHIIDWVVRANEVFAPARFGFSYDPGAGLVDVSDTVLNRWSDAEDPRWLDRVLRANELAAEYPDELVVLIPRGPVGDELTEDFASRHTDFVVLGEWDEQFVCDTPDLHALAHQIGRHLALPTTFATTFPTVADAADALAEAGQSPEVFDGDGFEDTAPDPGVYEEHQCTDQETVTVGGLVFDLPRSNVMSLYPERETITLEQVDRARWMLELRRGNGLMSPSNTPADTALDAEDALIGTQGRCGLPSNEAMDAWIGYQWVDGDQLLVPAQEGCMLELELTVEEPGAYEIVLLATRGPEYGAIELSIDGEAFHLEDLYAPALVASGPISIGETTVSGSSLNVSVEVVGSNVESSGSTVGLDAFVVRSP